MRKYFCKSFKVITLLNDCYTGKPKAKLLAHPIQIDISVSNVTRSGTNVTNEGVKLYLIRIRFLQLRITTQSCEHRICNCLCTFPRTRQYDNERMSIQIIIVLNTQE